ncbi:Rha family transcriptional regulator [Paenibacillus sp. WLX2291]|uniref:Rha family transcriptional regulator n=1 Tax=Paenibacillus sp. WLX2291 TaxID=3296934 RepID=UPI0039844BC1
MEDMEGMVFLVNGQPKTDSLKVAKMFGKRHDHVIRDIRNLDCSKEFSLLNFGESEYRNDRERPYPNYEMTKDGFIFLVMGYRGKEAARFKERYIEAFNRMSQQLQYERGEQSLLIDHPLLLPEPQINIVPLYDVHQSWRIQLNPHHMSVDIDFPTLDVLLDAVYDIGAIEQGQMMDLFGVRQQHIHSLLNTGELIAHDLYLAGRQMTVYTLGLGATGHVRKEPQHIQYWSIEDWLSKLVFFEFVKHMQGELPAFTIQAAKPPFIGQLLYDETEEAYQVLVLQRLMGQFEIPDDNGIPIYALARKLEYAEQLTKQKEQVTVYEFASFMSDQEILPQSVQPNIDPFDLLDSLR